MPLLHVEKHGQVLDKEVRDVLSLLEECYDRLRPKGLDLVEIALFENDALWRSHTAAEQRKAGVASGRFDDAFIAAHDAWTGIPRISISLDRRRALDRLVWEGALRHEAGHSVLHGGLEYYVFPTPKALLNVAVRFPALTSHLTDILYLLTLAVKDLEVTKLLVSNGYSEDQAAYARFVMKPTEQDQNAWHLSSIAAEARVLCLIGRLKDIAAAMILAATPQPLMVTAKEIEESIAYFPPEPRRILLDTMTSIMNDLGKDTFGNVQSAAAAAAERLVEPIMGAHGTKQSLSHSTYRTRGLEPKS
jgi:hypothetical protein